MGDSSPIFVVGSGPAGLAAAMALSRSGLPVRLLERGTLVGGKVNSHHGNGWSLEHGVHGWWTNYVNFDRLLRWANVNPTNALQEANGSELILPDGRRYPLKPLRWDLPSPFFFLVQILKAPYLSLGDLLSAVPLAIHALAFRHELDYDRYDVFSFQQLLEFTGVSERLQKLLFEIFVLSFDFTTPDRVSAACGLSGLQFYVLRDQRSILSRWAKGLPADVIFGPIAQQLRCQGVEISLSTSLQSVTVSDGKLTGVRLVDAKSPPVPGPKETELGRIALASVPEGSLAEVTLTSGTAWVGRAGDAVSAVSARCTHEGCTVDWKPEGSAFVCPCHGGRFDRQGNVLQGPPKDPLEKLTSRIEGQAVVILGEAGSDPQPCSDVVLATDLEAAKRIVAESDRLPTKLRHDIGHLDTTPVIVVRIWFDSGLPPEQIESAFTPGFAFVDNFFYLNSFDREIGREGHVVEVQAYRAGNLLDASDETILAVALTDLSQLHPGYTRQNVTHFTVNRHRALFTHYGAEQNAFRPSEQSGVEGLYLAGDWTQAPWSVWMMERGVVSGIRAANAVLRRRGLPEVEILRLPRENILLRVSRTVALILRITLLRNLPRSSAPSEQELAVHNERDHTVVGWMAFYVAVCNLLPLFAPDFAALRKAWQIPFLLLSVASFFHIEPDVQYRYGSWRKAWADRSTLQHRLMTLLAIAGTLTEITLAFTNQNSLLIRSLFPAGMIATGITFLGHQHRHKALIARQHRIMGTVFILTGLSWLSSRLISLLAPLSYAWPMLYAFQAYLFIRYTEREDLAHAGHGQDGDHDHHDGHGNHQPNGDQHDPTA